MSNVTNNKNLAPPQKASLFYGVRLPKYIGTNESADSLTLYLEIDRNYAMKNMQEDNAAFEAWALLGKSKGYAKVELFEKDNEVQPTKVQTLHYNRFLYRALCFEEGFNWFSLSPQLKQKTLGLKEKISNSDLFVGTPTSPSKTDSDMLEAKIERLLIRDNMRGFMNESLLKADVDKYFNQLPASLFFDDAKAGHEIFSRGGARIDIWGLDGNTIHIIELKVKNNTSLGVLSEIFFYSCFIREMYCQRHLERKDPPNLRKYEKFKEERGYYKLINASVDSVSAHILTENKHPHLDAALRELQKCNLDKIRFENVVCYSFSNIQEPSPITSTIYRGTCEIGGTLIELCAGGTRVLLDAGYPLFLNGNPIDNGVAKLPPEELLKLGVLPPIKGLYQWDSPDIDGVIISHAHLDHYGLLKYVHPDIPVYLSAGTKKLIEVTQLFKICEQYPINAQTFKMYEPFVIGDFTIKPYLMDHSAFDAAAFEIKAGGKTVIYSGDFRGHGRKAKCLDSFIKQATKQADVLFTEGSMVSRSDELTITEDELEMAVVEELKGKKGIALIQSSSQNIDRIVSFYRAALRLGKIFVVDVYTANILHELNALGNNIPFPSYAKIKVFYPYRLTQKVFKEIGEEYAKRFSRFRITKEQVEAQQSDIVMIVRPSMKKDLEKCNLLGGTFIYSMWQGYRDSEYQQNFETWLEEQDFSTAFLHTSGHAKVSDIKRLIDGLDPKKIVPIHTMMPDAFLDYSDKVEIKQDGVVFSV